jgi:TonB family protein
MKIGALLLGALLATIGAAAQQTIVTTQPAPPDPTLELASDQIGRALFLRCFCAEDNLNFDAQGQTQGQAKKTDWTLSAVNVQKVERHPSKDGGPGDIELDGVRVAIRYAPDRNEFDRHPQNAEKMKILVADNGDSKTFQKTLNTIFATGIDMPLQRSLPEYWQHYFNPQKPWDKDDLTGQPVLDPSHASEHSTSATALHKVEATYTPAASADHVQGSVVLRGVVDLEGALERISIVQPLGYGLDEKAVAAAAKQKFSPATLDGKPIDQFVQMRQEFVVVTTNVNAQ